ncbi:MAG: alpha amylase, catalytic region, partial [Chloroflexi bacterium]|nr:alpha amylase, catalytic region [Chloroflexota bacterium]
ATPTPIPPTHTPLPIATATQIPPLPVQPLFRGNPERTGVYAQSGDFGNWKWYAGAPITGSPVLVEGTLFIGSMQGRLYALDPATQSVKWQADLPAPIFSTPAIAGKAVYVGTLGGTFHALDATNGNEIWRFQAGDAIISSPAIADNIVYFGSFDQNIYALDTGSGELRWKHQTGGDINSSPVVSGGTLLIGSEDSFVYALDANTGKKIWLYLAEAPILSSPTVLDGVVYIGTESESGDSANAIDLATGNRLWKAPYGVLLTTFAAGDDALYGASVMGGVGAVNPEDGSLLWSHETGVFIISSPAVLDDQIIYGDGAGIVHALSAKNGDEQWSYQTQGEIWSSPAIAGETVFFGSADGYLYALDRHAPNLPPDPVATSIPIQPTPTAFPAEPQPTITGTNGLPWWNDRVFYEVFVRSFKDSNGDGIGDLQGLIEKLDYLNDGDPTTTSDLGVTGLWLMPVAESPSYHGYDVTDYRAIEQDYGTNADFKQLIEEARQRGMVVIVDMVMNHTSNQHPWFREATQTGSKTENWYIWSPDKGDYLSPWGSEVWHQSYGGDIFNLKTGHLLTDYYYGLFWEGMPDLNYNNGAVTDEMFDILQYWLKDMGADGYRLDAVRHLIEDGEIQENTPATHAWLQSFDNYVHTVNPNALTVGEIWDDTVDVVPYVPEEIDIAFEFKLAEAIIQAVNTGDHTRLITQTQTVLDSYPEGQFAPFLTNHDITRVMTQLGEDPAKAKLAATIFLSMPGVPFIYYGEEIGLTGAKPDDIDLRRPMQWDASSANGFTTDTPWVDPGTPSASTNVEAQTSDPASLLSRYRDLIRLRTEQAALRAGDAWVVSTENPAVFALLRYLDGEAVLLVVNLSDQSITDYSLSLDSSPLQGAYQAGTLLGEGSPRAPQVNAQGGFTNYVPIPDLGAYQAALISLK